MVQKWRRGSVLLEEWRVGRLEGIYKLALISVFYFLSRQVVADSSFAS